MAQAKQTRQQFSGLCRDMPPPSRPRVAVSVPRDCSQMPAHPSRQHGPQRPPERLVRYHHIPASFFPSKQPWASEPNRCPPRASKGQGASLWGQLSFVSPYSSSATGQLVHQTPGCKLQFRRRPPALDRVKMIIITDLVKSLALDQELSALLAKGAIKPVDPLSQPRGLYSTYFLVKKTGSGLCSVLDLRGLNKFLKVLPFHMLTITDILRTIAKGEWFTSVNLKDAYFHVPIMPHHRPATEGPNSSVLPSRAVIFNSGCFLLDSPSPHR